jgi:hypothetical protein
MTFKPAFISVVALVVMSLSTIPAGAQDRRSNGHERGGGRASAGAPAPRQGGVERAAPRQMAPQVRESGPRQSAPRAYENRSYRAPAPRAFENRSYQSPGPRAYGNRSYQAPAPRAYENRSYQSQQRAVPRFGDRPGFRSDYGRGYVSPRGGYREFSSRPSFYSRLYVRPRNFVPYRSFYFSRPYYTFRPYLSLGFGLSLGYSVPYPWAYLGDYTPRVYGYYGSDDSYDVTPSVSVYGGVSLDIQPADADLFVDGQYAGPVGNFGPDNEPLTLTPGVHRIAVQRDGFRAMEWDVTIEPGQVIPYRGAMERQ